MHQDFFTFILDFEISMNSHGLIVIENNIWNAIYILKLFVSKFFDNEIQNF